MAARIRTATVEDTDLVLDILTLAFVADPCTRYMWDKPADYLAGYRRLAMAMGGGGVALGAAVVTEAADAAALWLPPGTEPEAETLRALIGDAVADNPEKQAVIGQVAGQMAGYHPTEPHWYLAMIGVDPARQGQGLGSALLKHTVRRCDEAGQIAYLESSNMKNVPLYERHGFEVLGVIQPADFPPLVPMLRAPR